MECKCNSRTKMAFRKGATVLLEYGESGRIKSCTFTSSGMSYEVEKNGESFTYSKEELIHFRVKVFSLNLKDFHDFSWF